MKNILAAAFAVAVMATSSALAAPGVIPWNGQQPPNLNAPGFVGPKVTLVGSTTNASLYVTNYPVPRALADTNYVVVYDIGDVSRRGTYKFAKTLLGVGQFTNVLDNTKIVAYDPNSLDFGLDGHFSITNGAGGELYVEGQSLSPPAELPAQLLRGIGIAGNGTITFGTNWVTNYFQEIVVVPLTLPHFFEPGKVFVETWGNDLSGLRGRRDYPFRNLTPAFTNALAGDVIAIGAGHFTNDSGLYGQVSAVNQLKNFESIKGSGVDVTFIDGSKTLPVYWYYAQSNTFSDFTSVGVKFHDAVIGVSTNVVFRNIKASSDGDVIVFESGSWNPSIWNCELDGNSDKIADLTSPGNPAIAFLTNSVVTVENTRISGGSGIADGIPDGINTTGILSWRGGGIHVDVDGASWEEHILTNGIAGWKGPGSYVLAPALYRTNWIGGQLYTNWSSGWLEVKGVSVLTEAAVVGGAAQQLWVYNKSMAGGGLGTTNQHARQTTAATSAGTNAVTLTAWIPPGYVFAFTNRSGGAGNSAIVLDGQYFVP